MIYRILTELPKEDSKLEYLLNLVRRSFIGFNITLPIGYYQGKKEDRLCIEIDTLQDDNRIGVYRLAEEIKIANNQECVLLQIIGEKSILV